MLVYLCVCFRIMFEAVYNGQSILFQYLYCFYYSNTQQNKMSLCTKFGARGFSGNTFNGHKNGNSCRDCTFCAIQVEDLVSTGLFFFWPLQCMHNSSGVHCLPTWTEMTSAVTTQNKIFYMSYLSKHDIFSHFDSYT